MSPVASRSPTWALAAPVPPDVLLRVLEKDEDYADCTVVEGTAAHHAVAGYDPVPVHGEEEELAERLSLSHAGTFWLLYFDADPLWVVAFEGGRRTVDREDDPFAIAEGLWLSTLFPPKKAEPRSFVLVVEAAPEDVARALNVRVPSPGATLHLEKTVRGTLGWTEGATLGVRAAEISRKLGRRAYSVVDGDASFRVRVFENGKETTCFEDPPTSWSDACRVDAILGATTRDGILRAIGAAPRR